MKLKLTTYFFIAAVFSMLLILNCLSASASKIDTKVYINVYYKQAMPNDSLTLILDDDLLFTVLDQHKNKVLKTVKNNEGYFRFVFKTNKEHGYFSIRKPRTFSELGDKLLMPLLEPQFWERGDSITLQLSHKETGVGIFANCKFTGKGAAKYNAKNEILNFDEGPVREKEPVPSAYFNGNILAFKDFYKVSDIDKAKLDVLENYKKRISPISYEILKAQILFPRNDGLLYQIHQFYRDSIALGDPQIKDAFLANYKSAFENRAEYNISTEALENSLEYLNFLFYKFQADSYIYHGSLSLNWIYEAAKRQTKGKIHDNLVIMLFVRTVRNSDNVNLLYADANLTIKDPVCLKLLNELQRRSSGKKFSNFDLQDIYGKSIQLSEFKNKVVLLDFWFTGCGYCQQFYKNVLTGTEQKFKDNPNVVFISISVDRSKSRWLKSVQSGGYTTLSAVNLYTNGQGDQHPVLKSNQMKTFPVAVLLDKNGEIKYFNSDSLYKLESLVASINGELRR